MGSQYSAFKSLTAACTCELPILLLCRTTEWDIHASCVRTWEAWHLNSRSF
jgi:hypothetical protein